MSIKSIIIKCDICNGSYEYKLQKPEYLNYDICPKCSSKILELWEKKKILRKQVKANQIQEEKDNQDKTEIKSGLFEGFPLRKEFIKDYNIAQEVIDELKSINK